MICFLICFFILSVPSLTKAQEIKPTLDSCLLELELMNNENFPYQNFEVIFMNSDSSFFKKQETNESGKLKIRLGKNSIYDVYIFDGAELAERFPLKTPSNNGLVTFLYESKFDYFTEDKSGEQFITNQYSNNTNDTPLQPNDSLCLIDVTLKNNEKEVIPFNTILFKNPSTLEVFVGQTNENGNFRILLPKGINYLVRIVQNGNRIPVADGLTVPVDKSISEQKIELLYNVEEHLSYNELIIKKTHEITNHLYENHLPQKFVLENIHFDFDRATLRPVSKIELNKLSGIMKSNSFLEIEIEGHTDNLGGQEYNFLLSENRAESVMNYLIETGIAPECLRCIGYGENKPIASNETEVGRQKNRRTVINILKQ
ncbi:MAG: OmpA family protein [Prolixibacteraceae bacterium]|nr:OmpA family protein [Prolixibacteraceae bacterium]